MQKQFWSQTRSPYTRCLFLFSTIYLFRILIRVETFLALSLPMHLYVRGVHIVSAKLIARTTLLYVPFCHLPLERMSRTIEDITSWITKYRSNTAATPWQGTALPAAASSYSVSQCEFIGVIKGRQKTEISVRSAGPPTERGVKNARFFLSLGRRLLFARVHKDQWDAQTRWTSRQYSRISPKELATSNDKPA